MKKAITYLFIFLLLISLAIAAEAPAPPPGSKLTLEAGTILTDNTDTYEVLFELNLSSLQITSGDIYLENIGFCYSNYTSYFNTTRVCSTRRGTVNPPEPEPETTTPVVETPTGSSDDDDYFDEYGNAIADKLIYEKMNPIQKTISFFSGDTENSIWAAIILGVLVAILITLFMHRKHPHDYLHSKYVDVEIKNK